MNRKAASKARQDAMKQMRALSLAVERILACKKEITPGKTTKLLVKCGKKNCRCAHGDKPGMLKPIKPRVN